MHEPTVLKAKCVQYVAGSPGGVFGMNSGTGNRQIDGNQSLRDAHALTATKALSIAGPREEKWIDANAAMNGTPSRCTGASCERMEASTDIITPPRRRAPWEVRSSAPLRSRSCTAAR